MTNILTPMPETQLSPAADYTGDITQLKGGNYVLTWMDYVQISDNSVVVDLYAQVFNAVGNAVSAAELISQPHTEGYAWAQGAQVLAMADGGYVVTWSHYEYGTSILAQRFDSAGHHVTFIQGGSDTGPVTILAEAGDMPAATVLTDGSFVISAVGYSADTRFFLHYAADGTYLESNASTTAGYFHEAGVLTALSDGSYLMASNTTYNHIHYDVLVEHHAADGTLIGDPIQIVSQAYDFNPANPKVVAFNGGYLVLWEGNDTSYMGILAQRFTNDGTSVGDVFLVNTTIDYFQTNPSVAILTDGSMIVAWSSYDGYSHTFYQQYDADGNRVGGETLIGTDDTQSSVHIEALAAGGFVATWIVDQSAVYTRQFALADVGSDGADTMTGDAGDDVLQGLGGRDVLNGLDGNDWLDGGTGFDTLTGGTGNDTYVVDEAHDLVIELADEGTDTVRTSVTLTLAANLENLILTGVDNVGGTGNALDNAITGNSGDNLLRSGDGNDVLDGGFGADTLLGNLGDDTFIVNDANDLIHEFAGEGTDTVLSSVSFALGGAYVETLTLTGTADIDAAGNGLANTLNGNSGNNHLDGAGGGDILAGGAGNDTYNIDRAGGVVVEGENAGIDLVLSSVNLTLAANVENLTLTGAAAIGGTGNALDNTMTGNSANNLFNGGGGNDLVDGGAGADTMLGNLGDDTYIINDANDLVREFAGEGNDTVLSSVSYALGGAYVETLTLTGTADIDGTGNALDNTLNGNTGSNHLEGGAGNDTYSVDNSGDVVVENSAAGFDLVRSSVSFTLGANVEILLLTGTADVDGTGNGLANILSGNTGRNHLEGGAGDDTYFVDHRGDVVVENSDAGSDLVWSSVNFTLGANVENLILGGVDSLAGAGNGLDNALFGNSGNNLLNGGGGDDRIDGGAGADTMLGNLGDDTFTVDDGADLVREFAGEGTDTILSSVSYALGSAYVEVLTLTGSADIDATGNATANTVTGNDGANSLNASAGNDTLDGGAGNDILTGGSGNDFFVFGQNSGVDVITDFGIYGDTLDLHAYSVGVAFGGGITLTQSGADTIVDLGGGNSITLNNVIATNPALLSHIVW